MLLECVLRCVRSQLIIPVIRRLRIACLWLLTVSPLRAVTAQTRIGVGGRRILNVPLTVDTIVDGQRDTTVGRPLLLATNGQAVVFFDFGVNTLSAYSFSGKALWKVGRRGQGPGEWGNPTSLISAFDGSFVVNDGANVRLVQVDRTGKIARSEQRESPLQRLAPLPDGRLVVFSGARGIPTASLLAADWKSAVKIPWSDWPDSAVGLGGQIRVASGRAGIAAVSIYTGRIMPLRNERAIEYGIASIDPKPLPVRVPVQVPDGSVIQNIPTGTKAAIRDAAIVGNHLFVLSNAVGAREKTAGHLIDVYEFPSLVYGGSLKLPIELNIMSGSDTFLVATSNDPYPVIVRLRWDGKLLRDALDRLR